MEEKRQSKTEGKQVVLHEEPFRSASRSWNGLYILLIANEGTSAHVPLPFATTFHYLSVQPPRLPSSEDVSKHTFSTWPPPRRHRGALLPVDVTERLQRLYIWTPIWRLRHWAWLRRGYWRYRNLIDWLVVTQPHTNWSGPATIEGIWHPCQAYGWRTHSYYKQPHRTKQPRQLLVLPSQVTWCVSKLPLPTRCLRSGSNGMVPPPYSVWAEPACQLVPRQLLILWYSPCTALWGWVSVVARVSDRQLEKVGLNPVCALKQGTLSYLLHLWTEM